MNCDILLVLRCETVILCKKNIMQVIDTAVNILSLVTKEAGVTSRRGYLPCSYSVSGPLCSQYCKSTNWGIS